MSLSVVMGTVSPTSWPFIRILEVDQMIVIENSVIRMASDDMYAQTLEMIGKFGLPGTFHLVKFGVTVLLASIFYEIVKSITAAWQELRLNRYVQGKKPLEITRAFQSYLVIQGTILTATVLFCTVMALLPAPNTWSEFFDMEPYMVRVCKLFTLLIAFTLLCIEFVLEINLRESIYFRFSSKFRKNMSRIPDSVGETFLLSTAMFAEVTVILYMITSDFFIMAMTSFLWGCIPFLEESDLKKRGQNVTLMCEYFSFFHGLVGSIFLILWYGRLFLIVPVILLFIFIALILMENKH